MIHYRTFRNTDSPAIVELWGACLSGRRVVPVQTTTLLEFFTLAKPYFDPAGLIFAFEDDKPVGFVHAGFALDPATGVICALGVLPAWRRRGIGSELLRRAENYLRDRGASELLAGPLAPDNPFTFGLYGGANSAGILSSDALARPFFEKNGYQVERTVGIFQRSLPRMQVPGDSRFRTISDRYDIIASPLHGAGWWLECVLGPVEAVEYRLQDKERQMVVARCLLWDMETFGPLWGQACVGLIDLQVEPEHRRSGLARYLMGQILRHLRDQQFQLFEGIAALDNPAALGLLQSLGFQQVETGHRFRRAT